MRTAAPRRYGWDRRTSRTPDANGRLMLRLGHDPVVFVHPMFTDCFPHGQLTLASASSYSAFARGVPRSGDANVAVTTPSLSRTNVARVAQQSASLNTPYSFATAPWGQKSLSTGKVNPCSSAQTRCEWRESQEIASTCAPLG